MYYVLIFKIALMSWKSSVSPIPCPLLCPCPCLLSQTLIIEHAFVCYILPLSVGRRGTVETQRIKNQKPNFHLASVIWGFEENH